MRPSSPVSSRRGVARRGALLVVLSLLAGALTTLTVPVLDPAAADDPFDYEITVVTPGPYTDGQPITIRIAGPRGLQVSNPGFCHPDLPRPSTQDDLTEWCTSIVGNGAPSGLEPADPDGVVTLTVRAGVGAARQEAPVLGTDHSWTCDTTSPCRLGLKLIPQSGASAFDTSILLTYREDDGTAACGGAADDQFATAAPDRLTEAWVAWTVAGCGDEGMPTLASFTNDGGSLAQFEAGGVDLAYSGVPVGTTGFGTATRPAVHTPVGLNATVVAAAGFHPDRSSVPDTPLWRPLDDIRMSTTELNALLSGDLILDGALKDSLKARNPQLAKQGTNVSFASPSTLAGPQATTQHMSALLSARMGDEWAYPRYSSYEDHANDPLGTFADYNTIFNNLSMITLLTGKPQLVGDIFKRLSEKPQTVSLVYFYLTDLATARQLGITPVALQDGSGEYVLPTPETLAAAVPSMVEREDGTRALDPTKPGAGYPLTFVEYAVTPQQEIVDTACAPKEGAVEAVRDWVGFLSGDGQEAMGSSGLIPLTAPLRADAEGSLERIGAAEATTGPCAPTPTPTPEATPPPSAPGAIPGGNVPTGGIPTGGIPTGGPGSSGSGGSGSGSPTGSGGADDTEDDPTDGRADDADAESIDDAQAVAASTEVPPLRGPLGAGMVVSTVTLVGLVALTSATGWLSGGRRRPRRTA